MLILEGRTRFVPDDLTDFIACEHLGTLERAAAGGGLPRPAITEEEHLVVEKGWAHERERLALFAQAGISIVEIERPVSAADYRRAADETLAAMKNRAHVIHGGVLIDEEWAGVVDFLERVELPSRLGAWSYEVADAKLARGIRPPTVIALCVYNAALGSVLGEPPEMMHAYLGDGSRASLRYVEYAAYVRAVQSRFLASLDAGDATYPERVEHCGRCRWNDHCTARRRADDHLSEVAAIRSSQIAKLRAGGIATLAGLARADLQSRPPSLAASTFEQLRAQAALQERKRTTGEFCYDILSYEPGAGFGALPSPDAGDCWFDMEGDPFFEGGNLEYLFGVVLVDRERPAFRAFWAHDRIAERVAFEAFIDFIVERRARCPAMHVYHYAPYETTAVKRLAMTYGTREDDVDDLLRAGVFVDLYGIVRHSVRIGEPSYSLKSIEHVYRENRDAEVTSAIGSVVQYERWRSTGDPEILAAIEAYNRDDCMSTFELHRWLLARREEAQTRYGPIAWRDAVTAPAEQTSSIDPPTASLVEALHARASTMPAAALVRDLVSYHRREAKPAWWAFYRRRDDLTPEELLEDAESIAGLTGSRDRPPEREKRSLIHELRFPAQDHKLRRGHKVFDPSTKAPAGEIVDIDTTRGALRLKRGPILDGTPLPSALIAGGPRHDAAQRAAVIRYAAAFLAGDQRYRALDDIITGARPRLRTLVGPLDDPALDVHELAQRALDLDDSYLFVQGPPGSGKTYSGAHAIVNLMKAGRRVGVTARSHKAIHNLLHAVEEAAHGCGFAFRGVKKSSAGDRETVYETTHGFITSSSDSATCRPSADVALIAGTAWHFATEELDGAFDHLVIDEAGQCALADAVAVGTSARNLVLLGDPLQLAQVSNGFHPGDAGASVLEHLLGENVTVAADRGIFLSHTYRMHPAVCRFVSELAYDGRLEADRACVRQAISDVPALGGAGLRYVPVHHRGNGRRSLEEAHVTVDAVDLLRRGVFTACDGVSRAMTLSDILVVTPYNAQVECIADTFRKRGREAPRIGTVDKFQGQEAPVVLFSLATSSGEEMPRDVEFLYSRNRLNVAISRARAVAVLVGSPALLQIRCGTTEEMRLVNALCAFTEAAQYVAAPDLRFLSEQLVDARPA